MPAASASSPPTKNPQILTTRFLRDAFREGGSDASPFVNTLIRETVGLSASDILMEPLKDAVRVRARIDGVLYLLGELDPASYTAISSRVKVLANLDPTEHRRIQEGQFSIDVDGRSVNLRVEIAQTVHGELIVIRVHEKQTIIMQLSELGFSNTAYAIYTGMLKEKSGLILVSGPTGCGKTTTLYSTINTINTGQTFNIMTIEDPVEFQIPGINQIQTNPEIGLTFAEGLRTILRLSPDIILVGEIRDRETAEITIESGLTGQLVLSTVHAEDAVGALFRLLDLEVETYLLNSALQGVIAQRLVRRICPSCTAPYEPGADEVELFQKVLGRPPKKLFRGKGCVACQNLTFKGRTGIYEVLRLDAQVRDLVRKKASEETLRQALLDRGFSSILRDGLEKCEAGVTTIDEVLRNNLRTA